MQGWLNICKSTNIINNINSLKDKNHAIISTNAKNGFGKIQHAFMVKVLESVVLKGTHLNTIKDISKKIQSI